jgi:16S rRNA C967 or C1407 C5-methylase (RsmB/RsmF family)
MSSSKARPRLSPTEAGRRSVFIARLLETFPELSTEELERMLELDSVTSFRVNPLRERNVAGVLSRLTALGIECVPHALLSDAFYLCNEGDRQKLVESELCRSGAVFIQNPSSYIPVLALDPQCGERVLDMCASPGGKTSLIAALTNNEIELWVNDKLPARVAKLKGVLDLLGVKTEAVLQEPAEYLSKAKSLEGKLFDKILLDAQCTGEGLVDFRDPSALEHWSLKRVEEYSYLQQRMLVSGFRLLKPGGVLVYSTCTFGPDENEKPVSFLVEKFPDALVEPIEVPIPDDCRFAGMTEWHGQRFNEQLRNAVRIKPNGVMDGFFVCKIRKCEAGSAQARPAKPKGKAARLRASDKRWKESESEE